MSRATVLIVGLGDLGLRLVNLLTSNPEVERLVAAGRNRERGAGYAAQARLIAALTGGPPSVSFEPVDLEDRDATRALLHRLDPDLTVMCASKHTWWRPLTTANPQRSNPLQSLPYGAWLPVHLSLVRSLMEAYRDAGVPGRVISLPYPDAVGPALAPLGLAPHLGAGNVAEVAAKLAVLAADGASQEKVEARLVMHHAAERYAFPAFGSLGGDQPDLPGQPPWLAEVLVEGAPLRHDRVVAAFHAPYPLPPGKATHQLTAAATAQLVTGLLSEEPQLVHAPAPFGRPGGYPILASRRGIQLDLPAGTSEAQAVAINARAARWDGLERIEADGSIVFTSDVVRALEGVLGLRVERVAPADQEEVADAMLSRARG